MTSMRVCNSAQTGSSVLTTKFKQLRKVFGLVIAAIGLSASIASAATITIPVSNPNFETLGTWQGATPPVEGTWARYGLPWNPTGGTYMQIKSQYCPSPANWCANINAVTSTAPLYQDLYTDGTRTTRASVQVGDTVQVTFYAGRVNNSVGGTGVCYFNVGGASGQTYTYNYTCSTSTTPTPVNANQFVSYTFTTSQMTAAGNLNIGFYKGTGGHYITKISDVTVTSSGGGTPTITTSGTLSAVNTTYGTASATPTSFTVSGANMTDGITVTPPAGFEVSQTAGGSSGYAGSGTAITVGAAGTIASTTVYVRLAATATVGSSPYSGNITCISSGATSQNVATTSSSVSKATPTATLAVNNSPVTYNGSAHAATVGITASSVAGAVQNILTGGAADQTAAGTYAVTADFVPTDTANYNTLTAQGAGDFVISAATTYTVTFNNNGGTGSQTDSSSPYSSGATVTVLGAGSMAKTGYSFAGWNTLSGGGGTHYNANDTFTMPANAVTLYAQWTANTYTVTFDGNSGGTPSPTSTSVTFDSTYGTMATVTRTGYTFNGWFTATSGGTQVTSGTTVAITGPQTLYAQWTALSATITGAATATAFTTTYGTASADQSFSISGANLTADITATAPTGFEVSSDGSSYGSTATFTQSGGSASGTLHVRLAATAPVSGSHNSQNVVLSSTDATAVNVTTAASGNSVTAKALSITAPTVTKVYNGLLTAGTVTVGTISGEVGSETVTATGTATAYSSANVGSSYESTVSYTLENGSNGGLAANYSLANSVIANAAITPATLTITANDQNKTFGTTQTTPVTDSAAFTSSGLQNSETVGTVTLTYSNSTGALDAGATVGLTSTITASNAGGGTFTAANYTIGYEQGTLTVVATLPPVAASGGTVTTYNAGGTIYTVHTFTDNGTFTVTSGGTVNYLVIGGGGGGGGFTGGGGGAGGFLESTATVTGGNTAYTVTVGAGGAGGTGNSNPGGFGTTGGNSVFGSFATAIGGGGGAPNAGSGSASGSAGGSGGGASWSDTNNGGSGGAATSGQGYAGGACLDWGGPYAAGGGGGAGAVGVAGNKQNPGAAGGAGKASSIRGTSTTYAGGGGGGAFNSTGGTGGLGGSFGHGGDGNGGGGSQNCTSGSPNTGSGGGGQGGNNGAAAGSGGSGIVIISYASGTSPNPTSTSATLAALENVTTALTSSNFDYFDPNSSALQNVQITALPALGTLYLSGTAVTSGDLPLTVAAANIGNLSYKSAVPTYGTGAAYTTIGIKVENSTSLWSDPGVMTVNVTPNIVVQDHSFETAGDWAIGAWGSFNNTYWTRSSSYGYERNNTRAKDGTWSAQLVDSGISYSQNLHTTVNAGDNLSVTFYVSRESGNSGQFQASFLVGATTYSTNINTSSQTADFWQPHTFTQTIGAGVSGNLSLKFNNVSGTGKAGFLDNVSNVSVKPAPKGTMVSFFGN